MKIWFTADTRPRIASGVSSCTRVWRTTTEMLSKAPISTSMPKLSKKFFESLAVPAVLLYNHFVRRMGVMLTTAENHARSLRLTLSESAASDSATTRVA